MIHKYGIFLTTLVIAANSLAQTVQKQSLTNENSAIKSNAPFDQEVFLQELNSFFKGGKWKGHLQDGVTECTFAIEPLAQGVKATINVKPIANRPYSIFVDWNLERMKLTNGIVNKNPHRYTFVAQRDLSVGSTKVFFTQSISVRGNAEGLWRSIFLFNSDLQNALPQAECFIEGPADEEPTAKSN